MIELRRIFANSLPGWRFEPVEPGVEPNFSTSQWHCTWDDGIGLRLFFSAEFPSRRYLEFRGQAIFEIDLNERSISAIACQPSLLKDGLEHLLLDQLVPRIRAHEGEFILHGGAVLVGKDAAAFLGGSGGGKSTLVASLGQVGFPIMGDDCLIISDVPTGLEASSLYPSLRLLPDSIASIFRDKRGEQRVAHYTEKRRLTLQGSECLGQGEVAPLRALYILDAPRGAAIEIGKLPVAELCMALVSSSFLLDPSDRGSVSRNWLSAVSLAKRVPGFLLTYPRDFSHLPEVVGVLSRHLNSLGNAKASVAGVADVL